MVIVKPMTAEVDVWCGCCRCEVNVVNSTYSSRLKYLKVWFARERNHRHGRDSPGAYRSLSSLLFPALFSSATLPSTERLYIASRPHVVPVHTLVILLHSFPCLYYTFLHPTRHGLFRPPPERRGLLPAATEDAGPQSGSDTPS